LIYHSINIFISHLFNPLLAIYTYWLFNALWLDIAILCINHCPPARLSLSVFQYSFHLKWCDLLLNILTWGFIFRRNWWKTSVTASFANTDEVTSSSQTSSIIKCLEIRLWLRLGKFTNCISFLLCFFRNYGLREFQIWG
jgi:hypothetical protein